VYGIVVAKFGQNVTEWPRASSFNVGVALLDVF
jgi:hypothetical protein